MNDIMFFNDYDNEGNVLVGFREHNVEKLYNCYGCYELNEDYDSSDEESEQLTEIDDIDDCFRTEEEIEAKKVLSDDGTPITIEELTSFVYVVKINGHQYTFESDVLETDIFAQEDENIWINNNTGERYFNIATDISNATAILKLESDCTEEDKQRRIS